MPGRNVCSIHTDVGGTGQRPRRFEWLGISPPSPSSREARLGRAVLQGEGRAARLRLPVRRPLTRSRGEGVRPRAPAGGQGSGALGDLPRRGARRPRLRPAQARPAQRGDRPLRLGAPQMFGAAAPDTGNMEMLAAYGTEEQKERWLKPLLNQDMFSAYSMTEPQGGSDPNLFRTHAVRDGDEWVINGEKWFTSRRPSRRHPLRDVHQRHVRRAARDPRRRDHAGAPEPQPHHLQRRAGAARPPARARRTAPRCWPSDASAAGASTTRCAPSPSATWPST